MFNDSRIVLPKLAKPVSFPALMALYESNYLRLQSLLKIERNVIQGTRTLWGNSTDQVHILIEEVTKYTVLLCIDEDIIKDGVRSKINHFRIRLYHDAKVAAVQSSLHATDNYQVKQVPINKSRIAELWQQNMFLNKWLEYCQNRRLELLEN